VRSRTEELSAARFLCAARSHTGCVRTLNEDAILERPEFGLWAIADGMGGHNAGDVASRMVVEELAAPATDIVERLQRANRRLLAYAAKTRAGLVGSTVVALQVTGTRYRCFWVGDSRAYIQRGTSLMRLTRDHTAVQELIDAGRITHAEAIRHPQSHVITRAVGAEQNLAVDHREGAISTGDTFLLCSDGLSNTVDEAELAHLTSGEDLAEAADSLLALALKRRAADNVSVVLIRLAD
jgi:serine/threonine protein phosphatase PrpC